MVYQSQPIIAAKEIEIVFPETGARATTNNPNGFIVNYYDNLNQPQSIFIFARSWGIARQDFERRIDFTLIAGYRAAQMSF